MSGAQGVEEELPISVVNRDPPRMPPIRIQPTLEEMMRRARERADVLRSDLAAATWHPSRMQRWCLSHDDEFAIV
jgi:hypothetical protein